jgi:hypothetical protein
VTVGSSIYHPNLMHPKSIASIRCKINDMHWAAETLCEDPIAIVDYRSKGAHQIPSPVTIRGGAQTDAAAPWSEIREIVPTSFVFPNRYVLQQEGSKVKSLGRHSPGIRAWSIAAMIQCGPRRSKGSDEQLVDTQVLKRLINPCARLQGPTTKSPTTLHR